MSGNRKVHQLKSLSQNFLKIDSGVQIRKNDRDFSEGDIVHLVEVNDEKELTGRSQAGIIGHIVSECEGLEKGFVVFKVEPKDLIIWEGERYVTEK